MLRTTKKELIFFDDFKNIINMVYKGAKEFENMISDYKNAETYVKTITSYEHECDLLGHKAFERVNSSFVTPIDREDIIMLVKSLDDIMDQMEETVHKFLIYNITEINSASIQFVNLIIEAIENLQQLIPLIPQKNTKNIHALIVAVNALENDGDSLYREEMTKLFRSGVNTLEIIKWHGIYDCLENTLDACEHVANLVEGIVMKNA